MLDSAAAHTATAVARPLEPRKAEAQTLNLFLHEANRIRSKTKMNLRRPWFRTAASNSEIFMQVATPNLRYAHYQVICRI